MTVEFFDSDEEMQAALAANREAASAQVRPWQRAVKPGDFYVHYNEEHELFVFGEILDPVATCDPDEVEYITKTYAQPHMADFRFARAYSPLCDEGELGDIHVLTIDVVIWKELFEQYRDLDWPQDPAIVVPMYDLQRRRR